MPTVLHIYAVQFTFFSFKVLVHEKDSEKWYNLLTSLKIPYTVALFITSLVTLPVGCLFQASKGMILHSLGWKLLLKVLGDKAQAPCLVAHLSCSVLRVWHIATTQ